MVRGLEYFRLGILLFPTSGDKGKFHSISLCHTLSPSSFLPTSLESYKNLTSRIQNLTLEELDTVFNVGNRDHGKYYIEKLPWYIQKYIFRKDVAPFEPLYQLYDDELVTNDYTQGEMEKEKDPVV